MQSTKANILWGAAAVRLCVGTVLLGLSCSLAVASEPARSVEPAQSVVHPYLTDRFGLVVGAHITRDDTRIRVDSASLNRGTTLKLEDAFGFDDSSYLPMLHAYWRMSNRWRMDFQYTRLHRSGGATATTTIDWGPLTFDAGAAVDVTFNLDMFKLNFGYAFYKTSRAELGVSLGFNITGYETAAAGNARIGAVAVGFTTDKKSFHAPLPVIGLYGAYAFSPQWLAQGYLNYMDLGVNVSGFSVGGRVLDAQATLEYQVLRNVSLGAGYRHIDVAVGGKSSDFRGGIKYQLSGPIVFSRISF